MQEQSQTTQSKIQQLIQQKKWEQAQELILKQPKSNQLIINLADLYKKLQFADEEQYEHFLLILISAIDINLEYNYYGHTVTTIISLIISLSSLKYAMVIIRGLLSQIRNNDMGIFVVLANLYLFSGLIFDPTFAELETIYEEFTNISKRVCEQLQLQGQQNNKLKIIEINSLSHLLKNIINEPKSANDSKKQTAISFVSRVIKDLKKGLMKNESYKQQSDSIIGVSLGEIPLIFMEKQQIIITKYQMPFLFFQAIISHQNCQQIVSFKPCVLSDKSFNKVILLMLCTQLTGDLNVMPEISLENCIFLAKCALKIADFLGQQMNRDNYQFLCYNSGKLQQFVEKVNIFLGAINPKEQIYQQLTKRFIPLSFLPRQFKQKLLQKLIKKHKNESFKIHLISQYRKLLTYKAPKHTWIRSTQLLMQQLSTLEPKSSVDFIGHVLSFAYYWKEVGIKLLQNGQIARHIHNDNSRKMTAFRQKLVNLKNGLQNRLKVLEVEKKEQQRNQVSVCLFRIQELLHA